MKYLICLLLLLVWTPLALGQSTTCTTKPGAIISISRAVMERALSLRVDRDDAAVQEMVKRGLIVIVQGGVELRVDDLYESPVSVRKPGSPDVFYTYKIYLECPNEPSPPDDCPGEAQPAEDSAEANEAEGLPPARYSHPAGTRGSSLSPMRPSGPRHIGYLGRPRGRRGLPPVDEGLGALPGQPQRNLSRPQTSNDSYNNQSRFGREKEADKLG